MELNVVEIINTSAKDEQGNTYYELTLDKTVYYALRSAQGTWKFTQESAINKDTRYVPVWVGGRNCALHLASLLERMLLAKKSQWQGPLPRILDMRLTGNNS